MLEKRKWPNFRQIGLSSQLYPPIKVRWNGPSNKKYSVFIICWSFCAFISICMHFELQTWKLHLFVCHHLHPTNCQHPPPCPHFKCLYQFVVGHHLHKYVSPPRPWTSKVFEVTVCSKGFESLDTCCSAVYIWGTHVILLNDMLMTQSQMPGATSIRAFSKLLGATSKNWSDIYLLVLRYLNCGVDDKVCLNSSAITEWIQTLCRLVIVSKLLAAVHQLLVSDTISRLHSQHLFWSFKWGE